MKTLTDKLKAVFGSLISDESEERKKMAAPILEHAIHMLKGVKSTPFDESTSQDVWVARAIFLSNLRWIRIQKTVASGDNNDEMCFPGLSLTDILMKSSVSLHDFTSDLTVFSSVLGLTGAEVALIKEYCSSYLITSHAVHKYKEFFAEFFKTTSTPDSSQKAAHGTPKLRKEGDSSLSFPEMLELPMLSYGWMLYLLLKSEFAAPSYLDSFRKIVCVINYLISMSPKAYLNEKGQKVFQNMFKGHSSPSDVIEEFSQTYKYELSERIVMEMKEVAQNLAKFLESRFGVRDWIPLRAVPLREILRLLEAFDERYKEIENARAISRFDERLYIISPKSEKASIIGPFISGATQLQRPRATPIPRRTVMYPQTPMTMRTPDTRPHRSSPLSNTMKLRVESPYEGKINAHTWISDKIGREGAVSVYIKIVEEYYVKCRTERGALKKVLKECISSSELEVVCGKDAKGDIEKLFYYVLSVVLRNEDKRLGGKVEGIFSAFLGNEVFHKSICVCCIEMLSLIHDWGSLDLKTLLDIFNLEAFYFCKIMRYVIFSDMPENLKIKMHQIEEVIIQELAWVKESPLYVHMDEVQPRIDADTFLVNNVQTTVTNMFTSPVIRKGQMSPGVTTSPGTPKQARKEGGNRYWVQKFIFRFARLADLHMTKLCQSLNKMHLRRKIWHALSLIFNNHISLMKNRHLDQIIICTIFAISRISNEEVLFKDIIRRYRELPFSTKKTTYLSVYVDEEGKRSSDIITFYNDVFLKVMNDDLKGLVLLGSGDPMKGMKRKRSGNRVNSKDDDDEIILKKRKDA